MAAGVKLTEKAVTSGISADAHIVVTQPETVEGAQVESVRRLPLSAFVDTSLSVQNAAADAKATGDAIGAVQGEVEALPKLVDSDEMEADLDIADANGNVLVRFTGGGLQTKAFDSARVRQLAGKKWTCLGDSLTEVNQRTTLHYHDYIAAETGITVVNLGHSGAGYYARPRDYSFRHQALNIPTDTDVITIFGSFNDINQVPLGEITDTTADTLCGCMNITFDNIYSVIPLAQIGVITPTPWSGGIVDGSANSLYVEALVSLCRKRGIPCLDLYHCSNLRPWDATFRELAYSKDEGGGTHPDETGHKIITPRIREFLFTLI